MLTLSNVLCTLLDIKETFFSNDPCSKPLAFARLFIQSHIVRVAHCFIGHRMATVDGHCG